MTNTDTEVTVVPDVATVETPVEAVFVVTTVAPVVPEVTKSSTNANTRRVLLAITPEMHAEIAKVSWSAKISASQWWRDAAISKLNGCSGACK
jgi:hypothetical protein